MQKVRNEIAPHGIHRTLQGDLFGLNFDFDSGIGTEASIQDMMGSFLRDTIGNKGTNFLPSGNPSGNPSSNRL